MSVTIILLALVACYFAQAPDCFFKRSNVNGRQLYNVSGEPCNVNCNEKNPCSGNTYSVSNGGSLFLSCTGIKVCQDIVVRADALSLADVSCTGDMACSGAHFENNGRFNLRSRGLNTVYLAVLDVLNTTAFASVWCDGCYGLAIHGAPAGGARSEIFCTRADTGNCGFFGNTGNLCCRGVGCDYHLNMPPLC
jgi:hypothetical protein